MWALIKDNKIEQIYQRPKSLVIGEVRYPSNMFTKYTDAEKAAIGIYPVEDSGTKGDDRFENTSVWNAEPTTDVINIGNAGTSTNGSGADYVCYAWHGVDGYSKFGTYFGTGNAAGPFIYTGFRPRMIFVKRISTTGGWWVFDSARDTHNPVDRYIGWQEASTEGTNSNFDFLSSGFKLRTSDGDFNGSGSTIIYGAWGDVPFKYNNTF